MVITAHGLYLGYEVLATDSLLGALVNPFRHLLAEFESTTASISGAVDAFIYLLPYWAEEWDANPIPYSNGYQVIQGRVESLRGGRLKTQMLRIIHELNMRRTRVDQGPKYN